jgi:hypothetical protein
MIRAARDEDAEAMVAIEVAAGRMFADVGMDFVAEDDPGTVEELLEYVRDGRAWVADGPDGPVAYLIAEWADGCVHIEQVSVHPAYAPGMAPTTSGSVSGGSTTPSSRRGCGRSGPPRPHTGSIDGHAPRCAGIFRPNV